MKKEIIVDLVDKDDVLEKYNKNVINRDLIDYIVEHAFYINKNTKIKLIINNKLGCSYKELILLAIKSEYNKGLISHIRNNARQIVYLLVGILLLFVSTLIEGTILKEIILIGGWVLIWEMMELVIFSYTNGRRRRFVLKKVYDGEIIENIIDNDSK